MTISFINENSFEAAQVLNAYIDEVIIKTSRELVDGANQLIMNKRDSIIGEINAKLSLSKKITQDRIIQLEEAFRIAEQLNITDMEINSANHQSIIMNNENVVNSSPLYLHGTKALDVEIQTLLERKSEESFVPGLRQLQQRATALDGIKVKYDLVKFIQV